MTETIITHDYKGFPVERRIGDGYIEATGICWVTGKVFGDYYRLPETQEFLESLSNKINLPVSDLINVRAGSKWTEEERGTWLHPLVAMSLGAWCSPEFAAYMRSQLNKPAAQIKP